MMREVVGAVWLCTAKANTWAGKKWYSFKFIIVKRGQKGHTGWLSKKAMLAYNLTLVVDGLDAVGAASLC